MPRRERRRFTEAELDAADVVLEEIRTAVRRCTLAMEAPLREAVHFVRALELASHAPEDRIRALGFVAVETRMRLEAVQELWRELRAETCVDTEPKSRDLSLRHEGRRT
jgi:hypothetical protein